MPRIDRIIQKQIEEANRKALGKVKVIEEAQLTGSGSADLSSEPIAPSVTWRTETYVYPLQVNPKVEDAIFAMNNLNQTNRVVGSIFGGQRGGFSTTVSTRDVAARGLTEIYTTRIMSRSTRIIASRVKVKFIRHAITNIPLNLTPMVTILAKSEPAPSAFIQQGYSTWTVIRSTQPTSFDDTTRNITFPITMNANDWVELALFVYGGHPWDVNVVEAFPDLIYGFDNWRLTDVTPPTAPIIASIASEYTDANIGTAKNILTINTPSVNDWLGVGIYRTSPVTNQITDPHRTGGSAILFDIPVRKLPFKDKHFWDIYGGGRDEFQPYIFIREEKYIRNLIPNGDMLHDSAEWRFVTEGAGVADRQYLVDYESFSPPQCIKSSASYSASTKDNVIIQSSSFAVDTTRGYILEWATKTEKFSTRDGNNAAIQLTYYSDTLHTLCNSTAYQIIPWEYGGLGWQLNRLTIHSPTSWPETNHNLQTGASALSSFIIPTDCTHLDVSFKTQHDASVGAIIYFDGANVEVDSGQPTVYSSLQQDGTNIISQQAMTLMEHTAFSKFRIPLRGSTAEIYYGHSTNAIGEIAALTDDMYRSSAHWAKFAKGIELTGTYVNLIKGGNFLRFESNGVPSNWNTSQDPTLYPCSTAIYGQTALGFFVSSTQPTSVFQVFGGNEPRAWHSVWIKFDESAPHGALRIGDFQIAGLERSSSRVSISADVEGFEWKRHTFFMHSSKAAYIWSGVQGTRAYIDGYQVETAQGYADSWYHPYDPIRIQAGATARSATYLECSSNAIDLDQYTLRFWYTPHFDWNGNSAQPYAVLFSMGDDLAENSIFDPYHIVYYRPWSQADSTGGYFEFYAHDSGGEVARIGVPRVEFEAGDPLHFVLSYYDADKDPVLHDKYTRLFVNGVEGSSVTGKDRIDWDRPTGLTIRNDNFVFGATKGGETATVRGVLQNNGAARYGHGAGVYSEIRIDKHIWTPQQVAEDLSATVPRPAQNASLTSVEYYHLADRVRDGSETETFIYEDLGVEGNTVYDYVLDAFDYSGNRSIFGDSSSITAGDSIAPGQITDTGYVINKDTFLTMEWVNPTDTDFAYCRVFTDSAPSLYLGDVHGEPGQRSYFHHGFVGYGALKNTWVYAVDNSGNEHQPPMYILGKTKRGPLRDIVGTIFTNVGYGLEDGLTTVFRKDSLSWGKITYTTTNPFAPNYEDMEVRVFAENSADPTIIVAPIKMGSVTGLDLNTSYHLYLVDSVGLSRPNALRMRWATVADTAESQTAYPLGRFYTGNDTVHGFFVPHHDVSPSYHANRVTSPYLESQSGLTYVDLQHSVIHTENTIGDFSEVRSGGFFQKKDSFGPVFKFPFIKLVPSSSVNAGSENLFESWGMGKFEIPPKVMLFPEYVLSYSTARQLGFWSATPQSLSFSTEVRLATCVPSVRITTLQKLTEVHTIFIKDSLNTSIAIDYPVNVQKNVLDTIHYADGNATTCAFDTATGNESGFSGMTGGQYVNSTAIARISATIGFYSSAVNPRSKRFLKVAMFAFYCSAASNIYETHNKSGLDFLRHKGGTTLIHEKVITHNATRTHHEIIIDQDFILKGFGPHKPLYKFVYASTWPYQWGAQAASEVGWSSVVEISSSGCIWMNELKLEKIIYYNDAGEEIEQTGYGIVSALVIGEV